MSVTYSWIFNPLNVSPTDGELLDVVVSIDWSRTAVDGAYSARTYGKICLGPPDPNNYTPFANLTKEQVESWIVSIITQDKVNQYDAALAADIDRQKMPPIIPKYPPW